MPRINITADTLDGETKRFAPMPIARSLFMTSLQKSGTHLMRNVLRMFVPIEQQYRRAYIQAQNLPQNLAAFATGACWFSFGHLSFSPAAALHLAAVRKIVLHRDPYDWVLARARFVASDQFDGGMELLKDPRIGADDLIALMIVGIPGKLPGLAQSYRNFVIPWLSSELTHVVRYEDLAKHCGTLDSADAEVYFENLFDVAGIQRPADWMERVRVGSAPENSATARQNLSGVRGDLPQELSEAHRRLVDFSAPGLRALLGYSD